ncbi:MAG: hypothetical protein ACU84J_04910, partial [Gammaproteobacteria bacterium]
MIELEIFVTLAASLTTLMLAVLIIGRNALRRTRLKHSLEILELAKELNCDQNHFDNLSEKDFVAYAEEHRRPYLLDGRFLIQTLFGIVVLAGFAGWAYYTFEKDCVTCAAVSAGFALFGLIVPFVVWRGFKQRSENIDRLFRGIDHYKKVLAERSALKQRELEEEALAAETAAGLAAKQEAEQPVVWEAARIPEDSILRRHYLANLQAEQDALTDPYPTDSILRRHRESMAQALLGSAKPQAAVETAPVQHAIVDQAPVVPEDSVLRRHYLANLQAEQDALTDPYPTDSILRRHRESMAMALL